MPDMETHRKLCIMWGDSHLLHHAKSVNAYYKDFKLFWTCDKVTIEMEEA
jgi:hypothetical protein